MAIGPYLFIFYKINNTRKNSPIIEELFLVLY